MKLGLSHLAEDLYNCQILLRVDNTTALSYVNKIGGVRYSAYHELPKDIWQWAERRKILLIAPYIVSSDNKEADYLSRPKNPDTKWEFNESVFRSITRKFSIPEIDSFASSMNAKCESFISWKPEPRSLQVDAFTIKWAGSLFYAFPPFSLILKSLAKIKRDKATGIIVVPDWPSQPWFPLFLDLVIEDPIFFEPNVDLLLSPCRLKIDPQANHLRLIAAKVSGEYS